AITILDYWLVDDFEKYRFRISLCKMKRERAPEFGKSFDTLLVASHANFELVARMNINDDRESIREDHVERAIDVSEIRGIENRRIRRVSHERRRFDRKAHVIEPHRLDQRDVLGCGMSVEMRLRVVGRLRKPVTKVYTAMQTCESRGQVHRFLLR